MREGLRPGGGGSSARAQSARPAVYVRSTHRVRAAKLGSHISTTKELNRRRRRQREETSTCIQGLLEANRHRIQASWNIQRGNGDCVQPSLQASDHADRQAHRLCIKIPREQPQTCSPECFNARNSRHGDLQRRKPPAHAQPHVDTTNPRRAPQDPRPVRPQAEATAKSAYP